MIIALWNDGTIHLEFMEGVIKLIPKHNEKQDLSNWRPLTLLNVANKILAKVIAVRLSQVIA